MTVSQIEDAVAKAHQQKAQQPPSHIDAEQATQLLIALWNLMISKHRPGILPQEMNKGPIEIGAIKSFSDEAMREFSPKNEADVERFNAATQERFPKWLNAPSARLNGKTPLEAILKERAALGNPRKEVEYEIKITFMERKEFLGRIEQISR